MQRGITLIHAKQVGGEQSGLVAAGPWTNFDDRGPIVERVRGDEERLELALYLGDRQFGPLDFGARFSGHLSVVNDNELARLRELVIEFFQALSQRDDVRESLVLTAE